jgi:hypothetical protein
MRTDHVIWKFVLRPWSPFVDVPPNAQLLSVGAQGDDIVAWLLCDPDLTRRVSRRLFAHPTGAPLIPAIVNSDAQFVGTVQMDNGLVFHIFDAGETCRGSEER